MKYGYARVSTREQDLSIQEAALKAAGCELIHAEKMSGTRREGRAELELLLEFVREGDELVITRIDRLARSIGDLQDIVRALKAKGVALKATEQPIDTSTAAGKCFLDMLGVFAEFETNLRRERQLEGIARAKAAGVYKGRKPSVAVDEVKQMRAAGRSPLSISRMSVYRALRGGWTADRAILKPIEKADGRIWPIPDSPAQPLAACYSDFAASRLSQPQPPKRT